MTAYADIGTANAINLDQSFVDKHFTSGGFIASGTPALVELKEGVLSISEVPKVEPAPQPVYAPACGYIPSSLLAHWDRGIVVCGATPVRYLEEFTTAQVAAQKPEHILPSGAVYGGAVYGGSVICGCISPLYIDQYWRSNAKFYSGQLPRDESISSGADYRSIHVASGGDRMSLGSGSIASGSILSIFSGSIASGQIAHFHIASGALCSGTVCSGSISHGALSAARKPSTPTKVEAVKEEPQPSVPSNWVIRAVQGIADWFPG